MTISHDRRRVRRRIIAAVAVAAAAATASTVTLLAVHWVATPHAAASGGAQRIGFTRLDRPAPGLALPLLRGPGTVDLPSLSGKPIVLNFWASYCDICRTETPALAAVYRAMAGQVSFAGIDSADLRGPALAFVTRYKVPYPVAFDPQGTMVDRWGLPGLPVTFFLSRSGRTILGENVGALSARELRAILRRLYGVA